MIYEIKWKELSEKDQRVLVMVSYISKNTKVKEAETSYPFCPQGHNH